ncbi:tRNA epoxyqueuosine(34) reductase QueG [Candidatus Peregrinibacteria bacterium]|jgi:epoxyqueuosine reductase|nr:tRNA epoxyqueuosine(34) reductase QueG [Candidatus Peregrinibacteria bacterium]
MRKVVKIAEEIGFDLVGITGAELMKGAFEKYKGWVKEGRAGQMAYLEKDVGRRRGVAQIMPEAQSVICLAVNYCRQDKGGREAKPDKSVGQIARYAYGQDYHKILEKMLKKLTRELREKFPENQFKTYVDTGAVLEKAYAEQAGLGEIGENTTLITPKFGSFVFLAEVITDLKLEPTKPDLPPLCGRCQVCVGVCPTRALVGPNELDARRCISYLTIEHKGAIPEELRPLMGDWLYGCDVCQEICPQNMGWAKAAPKDEAHAPFTVKIGGDWQILEEILRLKTDEEFKEKFAKSPIKRTGRERLIRNACVVAGNVGAVELLPLLQELAHDKSELIQEHAQWAINRLN